MGRWEPDARTRLERAALELFGEHGYDRTTVAEIAGRAGLTERTFFRHFADKREVLFGGAVGLQELLVRTLAGAPTGTPPIEGVAAAIRAAAGVLQDRQELSRVRTAVIAAHAELRERELIKLAGLSAALAATLRERGTPEPIARLAAEAGVAVFRVAVDHWVADGEPRDLPTLVTDAFTHLAAITAGT